jgi:hypothetical protein
MLRVVGICPPKASPLEHSLLLIEMEQKAQEIARASLAGLDTVLCSSLVSPECNRRQSKAIEGYAPQMT